MAEGDTSRLVAWGNEMRAVHDRLRRALELTREAAGQGQDPTVASRDLLLFCRGFCSALTGHHEGEDRVLFPAIAAQHPELAETLVTLEQDHAMIGHLVGELDRVVERGGSPDAIERHLEGIAAIMESHFRYEERSLLAVLEALDLDASGQDAFGPL
jgi:hemerythrin-like domain-containing protein